jgi:hypothetical protein
MSVDSASVIVDIDTLLDTRQGVLSQILSKEDLVTLVSSDGYMRRERDEFPGVDPATFRYMYSKRDKTTIENSIVSFMLNVVKQKLVGALKRATYNDDIREVNLLVNFYPYKLSVAQTDSFIDMLFRTLQVNTFVKPIYKTPEDLSPTYLQHANVENLFLYDTNAWLNANMEKLSTVPIPKRVLHLPAILTNPVSAEDAKKVKDTGFADIHAYLEFVFSTVLTVDYLPILFYGNVISVSARMDHLRTKVDF